MLRNFRRYLIQEKLDEVNDRTRKKCKPNNNNNNTSSLTIKWIESLLQTPIHDYRKYCLWRILVPYFVNVRKYSDDDSYVGIVSWLETCNRAKRLSFNPKQRARYDIQSARRIGYYPVSWNTLKTENIFLYHHLKVGMHGEI
jgi:hypothetical protein